MIKKNKPIRIDEEDIFKNDKLDRKSIIEDLSKLISETKDGITICINAGWGTGKTTFLKLWQAYLKKEYGIQSIYFSAWEDDFSNEPLVSLLGEIDNFLKQNIGIEEKVSEIFDEVKEIGKKIILSSLPTIAKIFITGVTGIGDKNIDKILEAINEKIGGEFIEQYSRDKKMLLRFQEALTRLVNEIGSEPFVIFVDELDRCRPLYAIEFLERIKHLFGVSKLIFIVAVDKSQLIESIKSQYGNINVDDYLKRFFDIEYNLKNPSIDKFCEFLYEKYNIDKTLEVKGINRLEDDIHPIAMLKFMAIHFNLTLRDIEHIFLQFDIIAKTIPPRLLDFHFIVIMFFLILKLKEPSIYNDLLQKSQNKEKILERILKGKRFNDEQMWIITIMKAIVYATSVTDEELHEIVNAQQKELDTTANYYQKSLVRLLKADFNSPYGYKLNKLVKNAIRKVEFADKFNFGLVRE